MKKSINNPCHRRKNPQPCQCSSRKNLGDPNVRIWPRSELLQFRPYFRYGDVPVTKISNSVPTSWLNQRAKWILSNIPTTRTLAFESLTGDTSQPDFAFAVHQPSSYGYFSLMFPIVPEESHVNLQTRSLARVMLKRQREG